MEEFSFNQSAAANYSDYSEEYDVVAPCVFQNNQRVLLLVGPYLHSIICVLGLAGNSLVVVTYAFYKRTKSMTDVYLLNVAVADLLFVLSLPLIVYNELLSWPMGAVACKLLRGSYSVNLYSGMLLLACISADRYVAIVQARRSFRLRSPPRGRLVCAAVWTCAFLLSVPTFYFYSCYQPTHSRDIFLFDGPENNDSAPFVCELSFTNESTAWTTKVAVPSVQLAVGFFLPLLVMTVCYAAVVVKLLRIRNFQRHKAVRVVLAVVVVFVGCHLPYNVALFYDTVVMFEPQACEASDARQVAKTVTQTVAYLHCCLNPVLYAFVGVKFRSHFRRVVRDLWPVSPRRFSRAMSEVYVSTRRSADGSSDHGSSLTM